jgi:hypothetical protein
MIASFPVQSCAWDNYGHMEIAYIAYQKLSIRAKVRANDLIKLNPDYGKWVGWIPASLTEDDTNMIIFMFAATWPDAIKSSFEYISDGDQPDTSPAPSANNGYSDKLIHKYWHFVYAPFSSNASAPNARERIALFRGVLNTGVADSLKSYDFVWLLHLVGDVHLPLHCTIRVSKINEQFVNAGSVENFGDEHSSWDDLIVSDEPRTILSAVIEAGKKLPVPDGAQAAISDENQWIVESVTAAEQNVNQRPVGAANGSLSSDPDPKLALRRFAQQRIALAGARLAKLINDNLN